MTSLPSATEITSFVATHISTTSSRGKKLKSFDLAGVINGITVETTISGAGTLTVTVDDPELAFWTSGMLEVDDNGLLDTVEVNFPEGSDSWWRLCAVDLAWSTDLTQPNVTLTFEDRIVGYLRDKWGPKSVAPGTTTRAQFIHQLVQEVGRHDGLKPIKFVCPSINVVQPLAASTTSGLTVPSSSRAATTGAGGASGSTSVAGAASTTWYNAVCSQESSDLGANSGGGCGAHQTSASLDGYSELMNNTGLGGLPCDTELFIKANGKTIRAKKVDSGAGSPFNPQMGLYPRVSLYLFGTANGGEFHVQIQRVDGKPINIVGGGTTTAPQGSASSPATPATPAKPVSDVSQLTRGSVNDPDESSWDCIQRLAQEVNWFAFSDANTLYFMDGLDLRRQKPVVYVELDVTTGPRWVSKPTNTGARTDDVIPTLNGRFDNTAFLYTSSHPKKGKIQRKARIAKPQTPTEIQFNLVCESDAFRAGEVVVFQGAGALNGRWIVGDCTRNVLGDTFSQLTVGPPTDPLPEPQGQQQASSGTASLPSGASGLSGPLRNKIVQVAQQAIARQASQHAYEYAQIRPYPSSLFGPAPIRTDCSGFSILCYKEAGAPDPNGTNFDGSGSTFSLEPRGKRVSTPQPADLVFYPGHVAVYMGNGQIANMGSPGEPVAESIGAPHGGNITSIRSYLP